MDEATLSKTSSTQTGDTDLLSTLLSDPERIKRIQGILASALSAEEETPSPSKNEISSERPTAEDGLMKLLGDPALLAGLPQILATVKPLLSSLSLPSAPPPHKEDTQTSMPVCRENLLIALRPFLSPKRCEAVDSMLRIAKLGEILGKLK
jgi:hypothetical protein